MSDSETVARSSTHSVWIGAALSVAVLISCLSGYRETPVPHEIKWQLSPLGLLFSFNPEFLTVETITSFAGRLGLTFDYLWVFLKTCLCEAPFYFLLFRRRGLPYFLAVLVGANLLTHPAVYFVFPAVFKNFMMYLGTAEIFAPLVESILVCWLLFRSSERSPGGAAPWVAVLVIFAANLFSWQMGAFV
jgi:hypothetical protein